MVNERRWLVIIFGLYFFLAIGYSLLMPIWEAPDEPAHFHLAWRLARKGGYANSELNYEASQPRAYYYFASFVISKLDEINPRWSDYYLPKEFRFNIRVRERRFDWNDSNYRFLLGVYILRWINIIFGALALWLNWKAFKLFFSDSRARLAAMAFAALIPQYLHIMSAVNNDALGTLAGALLFYLATRFAEKQTTLLSILAIATAIVLPFATKLTVLPISAAVLALIARKLIFQSLSLKRAGIAGMIVLLTAGFLYLAFPDLIQSAANEITWRLFSLRPNALSEKYLTMISGQVMWTFWGKVGWIAVGPPAWIIYALSAFAIFGLIFKLLPIKNYEGANPRSDLWLAAWVIFLFTLAAVTRNALTTSAAQGRLLFPALGALSALVIGGWFRVVPQSRMAAFTTVLILFLLTCSVALWLADIIPVYYQPYLD